LVSQGSMRQRCASVTMNTFPVLSGRGDRLGGSWYRWGCFSVYQGDFICIRVLRSLIRPVWTFQNRFWLWWKIVLKFIKLFSLSIQSKDLPYQIILYIKYKEKMLKMTKSNANISFFVWICFFDL
jgi:hypothetical protein